MKALTLITVGTMALAISARSGVIFSDNFDGENGGQAFLNYGTPLQDGNGNAGTLNTSFLNWTVTAGAVDIIGNSAVHPSNTGGGPAYDFLPGNGLYVDLDGTARGNATPAGQITSKALSLGAGSFKLFFDLAGSQRGDVNHTTVAVNVGVATQSFTVNSSDPFTHHEIDFTLAAPQSIQIQFTDTDATDTFGNLLDNVELDTAPSGVGTVPDGGSTVMMLGMGMIGLGMLRRKLSR